METRAERFAQHGRILFIVLHPAAAESRRARAGGPSRSTKGSMPYRVGRRAAIHFRVVGFSQKPEGRLAHTWNLQIIQLL